MPVASRKPLTFANWAKASGVGFLIYFGVSFFGVFIGVTDTTLTGAIGWIAGALLACYALELRYLKAYLAVVGGVFLAMIILYVAFIAVAGSEPA